VADHLFRDQHPRSRLDTRGVGSPAPGTSPRRGPYPRPEDTGLRNLPFHQFAQNQIWLEIVALAAGLLAWTQTLAFDQHEPARRWEPKRLRLRLLAVAGRIIRTGRRRRLRLPRDWPYNHLIDSGWETLKT
jgi:hypothetical protein